jgi:hypothetical protein
MDVILSAAGSFDFPLASSVTKTHPLQVRVLAIVD